MEVEHPGVFIEEVVHDVPRVESVATSTAAFVGSFPAGPVGVPTDVHSVGQFTQVFGAGGVATEATVAVYDFFGNGGRHAVVVSASQPDRRATAAELIEALLLLQAPHAAASPAQLICIPDMARRVDPLSDKQYEELLLRATGFCVQNRMFLLVDPNTAGDEVADIETWLGTNPSWGSANSALYFPRLHTPAGSAAGLEPVAASGAVAGVMARTDAQRGVWKAPAGLESVVDAKVATSLSERQQSPLNPRAVNVIRHFDGVGAVIWGARTGAGSVASEYRYVSVRRTAHFLEQSLHQSLQWAVFEPNGEPLWATIEHSVSHFMDQLWRQGAFVGSSATEAFFVRCGDSTMSRVDRRRGRTILEVGFAPARPAEFVILTISINRT